MTINSNDDNNSGLIYLRPCVCAFVTEQTKSKRRKEFKKKKRKILTQRRGTEQILKARALSLSLSLSLLSRERGRSPGDFHPRKRNFMMKKKRKKKNEKKN